MKFTIFGAVLFSLVVSQVSVAEGVVKLPEEVINTTLQVAFYNYYYEVDPDTTGEYFAGLITAKSELAHLRKNLLWMKSMIENFPKSASESPEQKDLRAKRMGTEQIPGDLDDAFKKKLARKTTYTPWYYKTQVDEVVTTMVAPKIRGTVPEKAILSFLANVPVTAMMGEHDYANDLSQYVPSGTCFSTTHLIFVENPQKVDLHTKEMTCVK